jgi:hypothetical protein
MCYVMMCTHLVIHSLPSHVHTDCNPFMRFTYSLIRSYPIFVILLMQTHHAHSSGKCDIHLFTIVTTSLHVVLNRRNPSSQAGVYWCASCRTHTRTHTHTLQVYQLFTYTFTLWGGVEILISYTYVQCKVYV